MKHERTLFLPIFSIAARYTKKIPPPSRQLSALDICLFHKQRPIRPLNGFVVNFSFLKARQVEEGKCKLRREQDQESYLSQLHLSTLMLSYWLKTIVSLSSFFSLSLLLIFLSLLPFSFIFSLFSPLISLFSNLSSLFLLYFALSFLSFPTLLIFSIFTLFSLLCFLALLLSSLSSFYSSILSPFFSILSPLSFLSLALSCLLLSLLSLILSLFLSSSFLFLLVLFSSFLSLLIQKGTTLVETEMVIIFTCVSLSVSRFVQKKNLRQ